MSRRAIDAAQEELSPLPGEKKIEAEFQSYAAILYDLCHSTLRDSSAAHQVYASILHALQAVSPKDRFHAHERPWVLQVACAQLTEFQGSEEGMTSAPDQIGLDALTSSIARLKHFPAYFDRLPLGDRLLLLMRDKYGLPYPEIASALRIPEDSLKARRARALRTMEEWIWVEK